MKILVAVKRVVDYKEKIRVKPDGTGIETENVRMAMNPFDENAVEAAVLLKEEGKASEVIAVTIGEAKCSEVLRSAMAMGADRGIHVLSYDTTQPFAVAEILAEIANREKPSIIILGKQAIDNDAGHVGGVLAGFLDWGQGINVSQMQVSGSKVTVRHEVNGGTETLELPIPCVITADLSLNKPRYASLPNVLKARQKPIETIHHETTGINVAPRMKILNISAPEPRKACVMVKDTDELLDKLRFEAGVL